MRYILIMFLILIPLIDNSSGNTIPIKNNNKPQYFYEAYRTVRSYEGNYSNISEDRGRETYGGISRRFNPNWYGWRYIDQEKKKGYLQRHDSIIQAEFWVLDYYLSIWVKEGFYRIRDKELAIYLFDTRIHHNSHRFMVNNSLMEMGIIPIDRNVKEDWVDERFNQLNAKEFILRLSRQRILLFSRIIRRDRSQDLFYEGWIKRAL